MSQIPGRQTHKILGRSQRERTRDIVQAGIRQSSQCIIAIQINSTIPPYICPTIDVARLKVSIKKHLHAYWK